MQSCSYKSLPPGALYNIIPNAGQHTVLQRNYGVYKDAMRKVDSRNLPVNLNITNDTGTNDQAVSFERDYLIPQTTCTSVNTTGLPTPWSKIEGKFQQNKPSDHLDFQLAGGLGPLVLKLQPIR